MISYDDPCLSNKEMSTSMMYLYTSVPGMHFANFTDNQLKKVTILFFPILYQYENLVIRQTGLFGRSFYSVPSRGRNQWWNFGVGCRTTSLKGSGSVRGRSVRAMTRAGSSQPACRTAAMSSPAWRPRVTRGRWMTE